MIQDNRTEHGMRFILTCLCCGLLAAACLHAADTPPAFPPNAAHVNVTSLALPQAEQAPFGTDPMLLVRGKAAWQNVGRDPANAVAETFPRVPVNEAYPSWFILVWPEPIALSALRLESNADAVKFYAFKGGSGENPALASDGQWERLQVEEQRRNGTDRDSLIREVVLPAGVKTRALKVRILEVRPRNHPVARISEFAVFGARPTKAFEDVSLIPPVAVGCDYPSSGDTAVVVEDSSGRRIRNLFAQLERKEGHLDEPWDLKDEEGGYVAPGKYRIRFTVGPKPELIYQMTPYPNVENHSPESTPWVRGPKDGWLANHDNHKSACVVGDRLYISAGATEGGHALIECDLDGRKAWGTGFGADRLFTDGTSLFLLSGGGVRRMNPADRKIVDAVKLDQGPTRKGQVVGLAAREGRIYAAYHGRMPRLDGAARGDLVDLAACLPKLQASVKRSDNYGIPLSPQRDFMSFFRLQGDFVAGDARNTLHIESTKGRGPRQHVVLAFREPVPLGSLVFPRPASGDLAFSASALKPDAPFPPNPRREADWQPVALPDLAAWNCVPLPERLLTRAVRLTFSKPDADLLGDEPDDDGPSLNAAADLEAGEQDAADAGDEWFGRLEGMRLLRARFENVAPTARVRVSSGDYDPATGEWDAKRSTPLSEANPGVFLLEWDAPQTLAGLALKEVDGEITKVDVFTGDGTPELSGTNGWKTVGEYRQKRRSFYQPDAGNNAAALYLDGTVDFGEDIATKAIRLRVVKQWGESPDQPQGVRQDRGGRNIEPARCRIYGVAALHPLGGDAPLDPLAYRRLVVFDGSNGKQLAEMPSAVTGNIAFRPTDGVLFGFVGKKLMRLGDGTSTPEDFIGDIELPGPREALAFDPAGTCYVWDHADDRRQIRVYDEKGTFLRSIGKPGRRQGGPYDPAVIDEAWAIAASGRGDLYAVYPHDNPRRTAHFKQDGTFVQDFLGDTTYGGGGTLDPYDPSRLYYGDLRFHLDWETGKTRLDSVMSAKGREEASPYGLDVRTHPEAIMVEGRRYLVSLPPKGHLYDSPFQVVCTYDEAAKRLRLAAAVGDAGAFPYLARPAFFEATAGKPLGNFSFIWADRNGDGEVQPAETVLTPKTGKDEVRVGRADAKLGFWSGAARYEVKEFLPDGTPVYERRAMPFAAHYSMPDGNHFRFGHLHGGERGDGINEVVDSQGRRLWFYRAHQGMDGLNVPPWQPGRVDLQFGIAGFGKVKGDLGDIFVIAANNGQWNLWTADGLLAGHLTLHTGDPRLKGWPAEHARGTRMENITAGQEHFRSFFTQAADGRFYVVIGGMWISVMEVQGLDRIRRGTAELTVTPEMLQKTREWETKLRSRATFSRVPVQEVGRGAPSLDGKMGEGEWPAVTRQGDDASFGMMFNDKQLFLGWAVKNRGRLENGGDDFRRSFKTGAAVDVHLGTRPGAAADRKTPEEGDLRILVTRVGGKPATVLYRPVAPGAAAADRWETSTPAGGTTAFDQVKLLDNAKVVVHDEENSYSVEAAIPLADLGLAAAPAGGTVMKMDWGVLTTDDGFVTRSRRYWANPIASGVSDEPTEARLEPGLWGYARFGAPASSGKPTMTDPLKPGGSDATLDDLLEDLE
jgi:hypothetical protein